MIRLSPALTALVALAFLPWSGQTLSAQTKKKGETISGTVVSIEKAKTGRSYVLKMKTKSDEEYDVPIVPRTQFAISAKGDADFLKPNTSIGGTVTPKDAPPEFKCDELTVYLGAAPPQGLKRAATAEDPTATGFEMSGKIVMVQAGVAQVQCGQQPIKLNFDAESLAITVKHTEASLAKEGDEVEIEGTIVKNKPQINAFSVLITSAEALTATDFFAALEEQKKNKSAKTTTSKSKSKKESAEPAGGSEADPFGVLKNKSKTKSKTDKAADKATDEEMKEGDSKPETTKPGKTTKPAKAGSEKPAE
ncbi:MAG: hypothetical protein V4719_22795 [Planctomycetota bacterium]